MRSSFVSSRPSFNLRSLVSFYMADIDVLPSKQQVEPATSPVAPDDVIPLPDIREARKKKALEEEEKRAAEEESKKRVKIKRGDTKALRDVRRVQRRFVVTA